VDYDEYELDKLRRIQFLSISIMYASHASRQCASTYAHRGECGSMMLPPAACMAADDPVAELTQRPLDHTLRDQRFSGT
jgi:hypothetical protein